MNRGLHNTKLRAAKRRIFDWLKTQGVGIADHKHSKLISYYINVNDLQRPIELTWQQYIIQLYEKGLLPDPVRREKKEKDKTARDERYQKYQRYLSSPEWMKIRSEAIKHWGSKCVLCCSISGLQGHHRTYVNLYNETVDDIVPLCIKCHKKHHSKNEKI